MSLLSTVPTFLKVAAPLALGGALAGVIAWGAQSGGGGSPDSAPAVQVAATGTAAPRPTPVVEGTPAPEPAQPTSYVQEKRPIQPVLASQGGRPDCPPGWYVWREVPKGRFSICYPQTVPGGIEALSYTSATHPPDEVLWLHTPDSTSLDGTSVAISITVHASPYPMFYAPGTGCQGLVPRQRTNGQERDITLAGRTAHSCQVVGEDFIQGKMRPIGELLVQIPIAADGTGSDGYILFVGNHLTGPDYLASSLKRPYTR